MAVEVLIVYCSNDAIVVDAVVLMDSVLMLWWLRRCLFYGSSDAMVVRR
jgi:hypothetical protein